MVVVKAAALIEGAGLRPVGGRSGRTVSDTWPVSLTQRSGRTGTIGMYEAGNRRGPRRGRQIDPRRPPGEITRLPVIELDKLFWRPGLAPTLREEWAAIPRQLAAQESWIMDGDLGPYDVLNIRLHAADAIVFLDFSPLRCAWRAIRRSPERADFWKWLLFYRRRSRPVLRQAIAAHAGDADVYVLPTPRGPAIRREDSLRHA